MTISPAGQRVDEQLAWLETMRETEPVSYDEATDMWHVFQYPDVARALTDHVTFSSDIREFLPPPEYATSFNNEQNFLLMDPPEHRRLRSLVNQAFTPRLVASLAPSITKVTAELFHAVRDRDKFDLTENITIPMPIIVISELLGLPGEDYRLFRDWGEVLAECGFEPSPSEDSIAALTSALRDMEAYLLTHVRLRRAEPADDIISRLIAAEVDGHRLDNEGIVSFATLLLFAGHVTTTALLGNATQCLDEHPAATEELRADLALIPHTIEEVLRYRPPFTLSERITTTAVPLGDREIPAGARVTAWIKSANRDAAAFNAPNVFDIHRHPNPHLGFGKGIHFCVGASLARLEADIVLRELLTRYHKFRVNREEPIEYFSVASNIDAAKRLPIDVIMK